MRDLKDGKLTKTKKAMGPEENLGQEERDKIAGREKGLRRRAA